MNCLYLGFATLLRLQPHRLSELASQEHRRINRIIFLPSLFISFLLGSLSHDVFPSDLFLFQFALQASDYLPLHLLYRSPFLLLAGRDLNRLILGAGSWDDVVAEPEFGSIGLLPEELLLPAEQMRGRVQCTSRPHPYPMLTCGFDVVD